MISYKMNAFLNGFLIYDKQDVEIYCGHPLDPDVTILSNLGHIRRIDNNSTLYGLYTYELTFFGKWVLFLISNKKIV